MDKTFLTKKWSPLVSYWVAFAVLTFVLFCKCLFLQVEVWHSILFSSIVHAPYNFWSFWTTKIAISLLFASLIFFFRRQWWSIVLCLFLDVWILANMMYWRSNGLLLDGPALAMVGNMNGFWDSIWVLFEWQDAIPFALTAVYACVLAKCSFDKRKIKIGIIAMVVALFLNQLSFSLIKKHALINDLCDAKPLVCYAAYNPFSFESRQELYRLQKYYDYYNFSVIHALLFESLNYFDIIKNRIMPPEFTAEEKLEIECLLRHSSTTIDNENPLILVLVESLESWAVQPAVMPNLSHFIATHPVAHIKYVESQTASGCSADGQMIVNTGLLPIKNGATCFAFSHIQYPSLVNRESSVTILPHNTSVWNQIVMGPAYGYTKTIENIPECNLFDSVVVAAQQGYKTILAVTITSHVPFSNYKLSQVEYSASLPTTMVNYMKCLNYTDACLEHLLAQIDTVPELASTTICITGDHSIFWDDARTEFSAALKQPNVEVAENGIENRSCPCIIYSPKLKQRITITDSVYQMDIYPTLLPLIGADDYFWHGVGINLLDSAARNNRKLLPNEAQHLSDLLIRSDYFKTFVQSNNE